MSARERQRKRSFDRTRRRLIGTLPYVGVAALLGTGVAAASYFDIDPRQPFAGPKTKSDGVPQIINDLSKWNNDIRSRPSNFDSVVPRVVEAAADFYASRLNAILPDNLALKAAEIKPDISIDSPTAFTFNQTRFLVCTDHQVMPSIESFVDHEQYKIYFNRNFLLQSNPTAAASSLFRSTVELLHTATPKLIPPNLPDDFEAKDIITGAQMTVLGQKGSVLNVNNSSRARPGKNCIIKQNGEFQNALSAYSTQQMLSEIGQNVVFQGIGAELVTRLQIGILQKWYGNDHRPLLLKQQLSQADQILEDIGRHRRSKSSQPEVDRGTLIIEGIRYTDTLLTKGQMI